MRSQSTIFVNCDKCDREIAIELFDGLPPISLEEQVDKELKANGWFFNDYQDLCDECSKEADEQTTTTKTPNSTAPTIS